MAKIGFTKLGLKQNNDIKTISFNEQIIEVKQYLSIEEKLNIISNVINFSNDEINNFTNPVKIKVYLLLEIFNKYTNINFTEKQYENPIKLYDLIESNGLFQKIIEAIPEQEYNILIEGIEKSIDAFDKYRNSIMNILDGVSKDYNNIDLDLSNIRDKITDPEALSVIKELANLSGLMDIENN